MNLGVVSLPLPTWAAELRVFRRVEVTENLWNLPLGLLFSTGKITDRSSRIEY